MMMIEPEEVPLSSASDPLALTLSPTYGFPVDAQPHPWNAPGPAAPPIECGEEALNRLARGIGRRGFSVLSMRHPPGGWSRDGMNALGRIALTALREQDTVVRFFLRATPAELLAHGVLPSLCLLEVERLEVLAGAIGGEPEADPASPDASVALLDSEILERSCLEVARNGLAPVSRVVVVLGLPFEGTDDIIEKIQVATRIAVSSSIRRLRFEWWQNVPGSPLYHAAAASQLTEGDRTVVHEAIEVIRLLYDDLEIECLERPH